MAGVNNPREAAETLVALRQQQELLQKLIEQQEQVSIFIALQNMSIPYVPVQYIICCVALHFFKVNSNVTNV